MEQKFPLSRTDVIDMMYEKKVSPTQQRVEIARVLFAGPQHVTADDVMAMVNRKHPVASKATVYNTLGLFARVGLVNEVTIDPAKIVYDTTTSPHYHFYNVDTGELLDVAPSAFKTHEIPQLPNDSEVVGVEIVIRVRNSARKH